MPHASLTQSTTSSSTLLEHVYIKQGPKPLAKIAEMIHLSSSLKINLVEPVLFMRGNPQESLGCFLRGELCFNLSKPTKIKKIEMKFIGKLKTFWPEGKISHDVNSNRNNLCEKREIITHNWTFLAPILSGCHILPTGTCHYPFELFLPGDIPETIEASRGSVTYKLVASVIRQGFSPNINTTQYIPIVRTPLNEQNPEGISVSSIKGSLNYEISIPKRAYALGDAMEIDLKLRPTTRNIRVVGAKIQLTEDATYKAGTQKYQEVKSLNSLQVKGHEGQRSPFEWRDDEYFIISEPDPFQISEEE
ncbi:16033_t:CDS:2, partial [Acaulospora colombiana]